MKLIISYQPAKFQILQLSESNFTEVGIRHPQKPLFHNIWFTKLRIFRT